MAIEERYWRGEPEPDDDAVARARPSMIRARKRFGQHFLEPAWAAKVVDACRPRPTTRSSRSARAAARSRCRWRRASARVLAVEVDRDLAARARGRAPCRTLDGASPATSSTTTGDARSMPGWPPAGGRPGPRRRQPAVQHLVADPLPAARRWRRRRPGLADATLMLQAEVADRLVAAAGTRRLRRADAADGAARRRRRRCWRCRRAPSARAPKVRSALVRLRFRPPSPPVPHDPALVDRLVRVAVHPAAQDARQRP